MFTLRSIFKSADSRTHPATAASGDPSPSPATDPDGRRGVGDGSPSIFPPFNARVLNSGGGKVQLLVDRDTMRYPAPRSHVTVAQFVGGDVPLEGGDSPSLPTTIDQINKALIEATAIMREQNDQLAAVHAALDQYEADLAAHKHGGVAQDHCYWSIRHAVGR